MRSLQFITGLYSFLASPSFGTQSRLGSCSRCSSLHSTWVRHAGRWYESIGIKIDPLLSAKCFRLIWRQYCVLNQRLRRTFVTAIAAAAAEAATAALEEASAEGISYSIFDRIEFFRCEKLHISNNIATCRILRVCPHPCVVCAAKDIKSQAE